MTETKSVDKFKAKVFDMTLVELRIASSINTKEKGFTSKSVANAAAAAAIASL